MQLVADDLDTHEEIARSIDAKLDKMLWGFMGVFISTATSAVVLAINLLA